MRPVFLAGTLILALGLGGAAFLLLGDGLPAWLAGSGASGAREGRGDDDAGGRLLLDDGAGSAADPAAAPAGRVTAEGPGSEAEAARAAAEVPKVLLLSGRLATRSGPAPEGGQVMVTAATGALVGARAAGDGAFRVEGPPGRMSRVIATASGFAARMLEDIPEGAHVTIILEPGVAFMGKFTGPEGKGVEGAEIAVHPRGRKDLAPVSGVSNDEGLFRIENVAAGRYDVSVLADGLAPFHDTDLVIPPEGLEKGYVLATGFTLRGEVVTDDGKFSIQGAQVEVIDRIIRGRAMTHQSRKLGPFVSDAEGRFEIPALGPGEVRLMTKAQGFAADVRGFTIKRTEAEENSLVIKLKEASGISGRVTDPDGNPVGWARVTVEPKGGIGSKGDFGDLMGFLFGTDTFADAVGLLPPAVTADGQGRYLLSGIPPGGNGFLQAFDPEGRFAPSERKAVDIGIAGGSFEIDLELRQACRVTGTVVDEENAPVEDARVSIGRVRTLSEADGTFALDAAAEGEQELFVRHEDFMTWREKVVVGPSGLGPLTVRLETGNVLLGTVTDRMGNPIVDAFVLVMNKRRRKRLGSDLSTYDGSFFVGGLTEETVWMRVSAEGYLSEVFADMNTGTKPLRIRLSERPWELSGDVVGTVTNADDGSSIFNFHVEGVSPTKVQIFDGTFFLQNLQPGRHAFWIVAPGFQRHRVSDVDVAPGRETILDPIALHRVFKLAVEVKDSRGRVLRGGRLRLRVQARDGQKNPGRSLRARRPARRDRYHVFDELLPGRYAIRVQYPGHVTARRDVNLTKNLTQTIVLRRARRRNK